MMKAERLLAILAYLQTKGRTTSKNLAEWLEVSERTILRDMDALSAAGIPVYAERGYQGGWALPEGYRNRLTGLTSDEISALLLLDASSVVKDLGLSSHASNALRKLISALPLSVRQDAETVRQRIHIDGAGWHAPSSGYAPDPALLAQAQQAVWEQRPLRIRYRSMDADLDKQFVVLPLGLVAKQSIWYLVAEADGHWRTYRISRMHEATILEETFSRPKDFDLAAYWEASTAQFRSTLPRYPAQIRVAASHWSRFGRERYVSVRNAHPSKDGWMEADVEFHTLESACSILLAYGSYAVALAPTALRDTICAEVRLMNLHYATPEA